MLIERDDNIDVGYMSYLPPQNIKLIKEAIDYANSLNANTTTVQAEATTIPLHQSKKKYII